jgi:MFS family permease
VNIDNKKSPRREGLKYSILDGSAYAAMLGLTQNYVTPLALEMKATTGQVGLLSSIPTLLIALAQLAAPSLVQRVGSRKRLIVPLAFAHSLMFIPILLVHYVFQDNPVWWLVAFVTVCSLLGGSFGPAWGSMMADLVPEQLRGRYFGLRGRINGFITLVFFFIAGLILQTFTGGDIFIGYSILFGGATAFRLLSAYFLSKQYMPELEKEKKDSPGLWELFKNLGSSNLGKFILYVALIDGCTNISGPFFAVFMLRDLSFDYLHYVLINIAASVANLVFLTYWGRRADKAGNLKVIKLTSILLPFVPLVWLVSTNVVFLMVANAFSGFVWSGYGLTAVNFTYDASQPEIRTKQLALFNALDMIACCGGALLGGFIAPHLPSILGYQLRTLFALSGFLRGVVVLLLLRRIQEVRHVPEMTMREFFTLRSNRR